MAGASVHWGFQRTIVNYLIINNITKVRTIFLYANRSKPLFIRVSGFSHFRCVPRKALSTAGLSHIVHFPKRRSKNIFQKVTKFQSLTMLKPCVYAGFSGQKNF